MHACSYIVGKVITVDIEDRSIPSHPRITKIVGDSTSANTINEIKSVVDSGRSMVLLDSLRNAEHMLKESELYSQFVSKIFYLVVADTHFSGHTVHELSRRG